MNNRKIVLGITGSSGAVYAQTLIHQLCEIPDQWDQVGIVMSKNALINWDLEVNEQFRVPDKMKLYESNDFTAPFASGSARYGTMIICPCSMGSLARIASGISQDLLTRAADVMIKERRRLILVPRETPLSLVHLRNMVSITESGAMVVPAIPSFYSNPQSKLDVIKTVTNRILDLAGFEIKTVRWGDDSV